MDFKKIFEDRGLSIYSIKTYLSQWNTIKALFDIENDNIKSLLNPDKVYETLQANYKSLNTIRTKIVIILVFLKLYKVDNQTELKYKELIDSINCQLQTEISKHEKTPNQEKGWLTDEDKINIVTKLKDKIPKRITSLRDLIPIRNLVMFMLQQDLNVRNDLAEAKLITINLKKLNTLSKDVNWIVLSSNSIKYILNIYKTSHLTGQEILDINLSLLPLLKKYQRYLNKFKLEWLFNTDDGTDKITRNNYGKIYSKIGEDTIGKHITTTINRHQDASDDMDLINKLQDKAKRACHSIDMHIKYAKR
jgi:hypothetical protein